MAENNENYLDGLLDSVMTSETAKIKRPEKKILPAEKNPEEHTEYDVFPEFLDASYNIFDETEDPILFADMLSEDFDAYQNGIPDDFRLEKQELEELLLPAESEEDMVSSIPLEASEEDAVLIEALPDTYIKEPEVQNESVQEGEKLISLLDSLTKEAWQEEGVPDEALDGLDDSLYNINNVEDTGGLEELLANIEDRTPHHEDGVIPAADDFAAADEEIELAEKPQIQESKIKKRGFLKRIFGNVPDGLTEEEREQLKDKAVEEYESREQNKLSQTESKALRKKEKQDAALLKAQEKKETAERVRAEKSKKKQDAIAAKKDEKLKRQQEIQELRDAVDEDTGRINKIGAFIVFSIFIAFAVFVIVGTNILTYNRSMEEAKNYYEKKYYTEAFDSIYGLTVKEADLQFYNQLVTIMYVQKQMNSYENFFTLELYEKALDSLLKGLVLYDMHQAAAVLLGVEEDVSFIRERLLGELDAVFHISEEEAENLVAGYEVDRLEYTNAVLEYAAAYKNSTAVTE